MMSSSTGDIMVKKNHYTGFVIYKTVFYTFKDYKTKKEYNLKSNSQLRCWIIVMQSLIQRHS